MKPLLRFLANPRKASLVLAVFAFLALGIFLAFRARDSRDQAAAPIFALREDQLKELNRDSDSDGLKDWEEIIYHTLPENPDTDGDGTLDGEEVKKNRDPLKPGPDDTIEPSRDPLLTEKTPDYLQLDNITSRLAERIGTNFIVPKLANPSHTADSELLGEEIIDEALLGADNISYFSARDIKATQDNTPNALGAYVVQTAGATEVFRSITLSPLEIFASTLERDNFADLAALDAYLKAYDQMIAKLKEIKTPSRLVSFHYRYMNNILRQKEAVRKIRNAEIDIVGAVLGAQQFVANFEEAKSLMQEVQHVFAK